MQFIFGYGSLICADSRSRTGVSGPAHPIEIQGISRRWSLHSPEWPATALSAHIHEDAICNGVYFPVDEKNLALFDQREMGYDRIKIEWEQVKAVSNQELPRSSTLWAYVGKQTGEPLPEKPIMQSYLDVILNGCLDYGSEFAASFTRQTEQWQHLVDDRARPMYPRPLKSHENLNHIDQIIEQQLPKLWRNRKAHKLV